MATDVDILPVLLSANLPGKTRNMQIVYIFVSTAGECSPALLFLTLEPQGKDEWSGGRGLSPHCWHGLAVSLCPSLPPSHALALAALFLCLNISCLSCPNLCGSFELLTWHCLSKSPSVCQNPSPHCQVKESHGMSPPSPLVSSHSPWFALF